MRLTQVSKNYRMGEEPSARSTASDLPVGEGRVRRDHGPSRLGQVDAAQPPRLPRPPDVGRLPRRRPRRRRLDDDALSDVRGSEIGFIFQSFNLIPQLNVLENIEVPLFYQDVSARRVAREGARELADRVGLGGRLDHRPTELSGGQQQRVAIARALVNDPLILLADEATGNLDSKTAQEILDLFDELHAEGETIVIVTHDPSVGERADRTIWLRDGRVEPERASGRSDRRNHADGRGSA